MISRAASILRLLGTEPGGLSLGQIAGRVRLPRSTVQRIVAALSGEGLVSADKRHGGIRLGPGIRSLALAATSDTRDRLRPVMKRIADETGETVDLAVLDGARMLFVDQIVGSQRLRAVSSIGESFPLTTTANGKAALACLDQAEAARLAIADLAAQPDVTRPLSEVLVELDAIRQGDLARDENEHTEGICALGFAVRDPNGDIFALSTPVPSTRFARVNEALSPVLRASRREVSALLAASDPTMNGIQR